MFNTRGQDTKETGGTSKSLQPGVVLAHIFTGSVKTSSKGDKKVLELILEGPELENFEGWAIDKNNQEGEKFKGQSARVTATSWTADFAENNLAKNDIMNKLTIIATELGVRTELDNIKADSIEDWANQAIAIVAGLDMFFFLKGTEEEYNGKTILKLSLPRYKFCSQFEDRLDKYDKNNKYHFKALEKKPLEGGQFEPVSTDFEM